VSMMLQGSSDLSSREPNQAAIRPAFGFPIRHHQRREWPAQGWPFTVREIRARP
jgi:hypothetical protein